MHVGAAQQTHPKRMTGIGQLTRGAYDGFHLVDLIITELKDHMTCHKFEWRHWWKIYLWKKNPWQDLLSGLKSVISTNERNGILTDHMIFKLRFNEIYQMKTTYDLLWNPYFTSWFLPSFSNCNIKYRAKWKTCQMSRVSTTASQRIKSSQSGH